MLMRRLKQAAAWFRELMALPAGDVPFWPHGRFSFVDRWRLEGPVEEAAQLLFNFDQVTDWWTVFHDVRTLSSGNAQGVGRLVHYRLKGFLPYELSLQVQVERVQYPACFEVKMDGDLCGRGTGRLRPTPDGAELELTLDIVVRRTLLRLASLVMRPLMALQHRWAVRQGELGLNQQMRRRRLVAVAA